MGDSEKREKGFFKFFSHEKNSQCMKIPTAFTKYKNGKLPRRVLLRDRYGNKWLIGLVNSGGDLYFQDGWAKFIEENNVEDGNLFVFDYDGEKVFDFKLFGKTACEKKAAGGIKPVVKDEVNECGQSEQYINMNFVAGYGNSKFEDKKCMVVEDDNDDEEYEVDEEIFEKEESEKMRIYKKKKRSHPQVRLSEGEGDDEEEEFDEEDEEEEEYDEENDEETEDEEYIIEKAGTSKNNGPLPKAGCKQVSAKREKHAFDHYGADIFRSGRAIQPQNPYFVTKIQPKRRDQLYVPVDFFRDHNLELPEEMIMRDPNGRKFKTRLNKWSDGRIWLVGGWRSLCRLNLVKEQDRCICEIINWNDEKDIYLQVHVVLH